MTTKLTLSVDEKTVQRAKRISRKKGKSLSKMVEEYLNSLSEHEKEKKSPVQLIKEILKGKITDPNVDWKKVKAEKLLKKYGI